MPSSQRSPYFEHVVPVAHGVLEAERRDVAGLLELADLPLVLDQPHLGDDPGEVVVEGRRRRRPACRPPRTRRGALGSCRCRPEPTGARRCGARAGRARTRSRSATADGRPTARRTPGRGRTRRCPATTAAVRRGRRRRPRPRARRRWSGCRRSRCAPCRSSQACSWNAAPRRPTAPPTVIPRSLAAPRKTTWSSRRSPSMRQSARSKSTNVAPVRSSETPDQNRPGSWSSRRRWLARMPVAICRVGPSSRAGIRR